MSLLSSFESTILKFNFPYKNSALKQSFFALFFYFKFGFAMTL